jgi:hypothetical protein
LDAEQTVAAWQAIARNIPHGQSLENQIGFIAYAWPIPLVRLKQISIVHHKPLDLLHHKSHAGQITQVLMQR